MWAREYELIYIARPDLADEDLLKILDRTRGIITDRDGHILVEDEWGKKKLAYEIKKYAKGHFQYILFLGTPELVDEIERVMRIDDGCLRFLTVKVENRVNVADRLAAQAALDAAVPVEEGADEAPAAPSPAAPAAAAPEAAAPAAAAPAAAAEPAAAEPAEQGAAS